ncbi:iron-containing alcohol dehydrogenase [Gramella jeungdoensis]|uniref:Iron-containing alcohol dehydrogenase n=1 Tax=Gramella jeungdoensis TaxID=708091 RepID=A0ABT0YZ99_9FLAO|nr:iron-containing alcohol dehydrogenase [Gramella jeungdoensis]MCM8568465.1 iron-containing alcohol dehydrogenase [Gramella jeungdoensis]
MRTINLLNPAKLSFGDDSLKVFIEDYLKTGNRRLYMLITEHVENLLERSIKNLREEGIEIYVDKSIEQEPSFSEFETILENARSYEADSIVGIGGGSVLDVAKLVAAQLKNTQSLEEVKGIGNLKERQTYLSCLPTTAGTGSEVSPNAIFIDDEGNKVGVISPFLVPDAAYICPRLTHSVPPSVTAATGIDALTHCLEAYANNFAHPMVNVFALEGIRLIAQYLPIAYRNGDDEEARANVALGSLYGGMCLGPVNTAAVHALSYPLGTEFHIAHGLSNAVLLPYVMEYNLPEAIGPYSEIALAIGAEKGNSPEEIAKRGIEIIRKLNSDCGIPSKLSDLEIPESSIDLLAENALKVQRLLKNNLREVTLHDAKYIYQSAF